MGTSNLPVTIGVCLAARDFIRDSITLEDVAAMMAKMNQASVLRSCAQLSSLNATVVRWNGGWGSTAGRSTYLGLVKMLFPINIRYQQTALDIYNGSAFVVPFVEAALAAAMSLACRYCPTEGGSDLVKDLKRRENFSKIILALQQSLLPRKDTIEALSTSNFHEVFPKITKCVLAATSNQNSWAKDLGRLQLLSSIPEASSVLRERLGGTDFTSWFRNKLGVSISEYQGITDIFLGYAFRNMFSSATMLQDFDRVNVGRFDFVQLSTTTPEILANLPPPKTLDDAIYGPWPLWVSPIIKQRSEMHIASYNWLFNKFLHGFPYLILEVLRARKGSELSDQEASQLRGEFGYIFEGYIQWLVTKWMDQEKIRIIKGYYYKNSKGNWAEGDLLLVYNHVAYLFEIKALVPPIKLRCNGDLNSWVSFLKGIAKQSIDAAQALIKGQAFYADKETLIQAPSKVYPCGIVYEKLPLRQPFVLPFEEKLSGELSLPIFSNSTERAPFQIFDVEQIEGFDDYFDLPNDVADLFDLIRQRAESPMHRYSDFGRIIGRKKKTYGIVTEAGEQAERIATTKAREMSSAVPVPEFLSPFGPTVRTLGGSSQFRK